MDISITCPIYRNQISHIKQYKPERNDEFESGALEPLFLSKVYLVQVYVSFFVDCQIGLST